MPGMDLDFTPDEDDEGLITQDAAILFAFDRSMRSRDQDGHLHVECVNISKANVCPYYGREIPNGAELSLVPDQVYMLYRDAAELEAAAPTFENKQLLITHVGVTAGAPQEMLTVGVVSGVRWEAPYLKARLTVWHQKGIDAIESQAQRELSSGYRYDVDMTPGTIDGVKFAGRMRNIRGNHVALVNEGRVGPDVFVTDEIPQDYHTMKASLLAATLVTTLGLDKKPEDVTAAINAALAADKVIEDKKAADKAAEDKAAADKAAADKADCEAKDKAAKDAKCKPEDMEKGEDGNWGLGAKDRAARDKAAKDAKCKPEDMVKGEDGNWGLGSKDEDLDMTGEDGGVAAKVGAGNIANTIGKPAQDAAIKIAVDAAIAAERALNVAREEVKPLLGNVTTFDTADAVYGAALDHLKIEHKDVHPSAWRTLFQTATKQGAASTSVVGDEKPPKSMADAIPYLNRLGR
jgi:uncharacterized protein